MPLDNRQRFRIGFTGSRKGMTADQQTAIREELRELMSEHLDDEVEAHHGDSVGADAQFHTICRDLGIAIIVHPSIDQKDRAFCEGAKSEHPPREFRDQSDSIVRLCEILIAVPDGFREKVRGSGTWMTVRRAMTAKKTIVLCYPDGSRETEVED